MKKGIFILCFAVLAAATAPLTADEYEKIADSAQDCGNVVSIAKNISVEDAKQIADDNPEITFFSYTKGYQMVLEKQDGSYRIFHHGDTVFFSGEPRWGSAPDLADVYVKQ